MRRGHLPGWRQRSGADLADDLHSVHEAEWRAADPYSVRKTQAAAVVGVGEAIRRASIRYIVVSTHV